MIESDSVLVSPSQRVWPRGRHLRRGAAAGREAQGADEGADDAQDVGHAGPQGHDGEAGEGGRRVRINTRAYRYQRKKKKRKKRNSRSQRGNIKQQHILPHFLTLSLSPALPQHREPGAGQGKQSATLHQLRGAQRQLHQADAAGLVPSQDSILRGEPLVFSPSSGQVELKLNHNTR